MTDDFEVDFTPDENAQGRIAYIKPTGSEEAHRLGIIPAGIERDAS